MTKKELVKSAMVGTLTKWNMLKPFMKDVFLFVLRWKQLQNADHISLFLRETF